jgi:hypothetical protein
MSVKVGAGIAAQLAGPPNPAAQRNAAASAVNAAKAAADLAVSTH